MKDFEQRLLEERAKLCILKEKEASKIRILRQCEVKRKRKQEFKRNFALANLLVTAGLIDLSKNALFGAFIEVKNMLDNPDYYKALEEAGRVRLQEYNNER